MLVASVSKDVEEEEGEKMKLKKKCVCVKARARKTKSGDNLGGGVCGDIGVLQGHSGKWKMDSEQWALSG